MAVNDRNRAARVYHALVSILLLLAGGALLGTGIWLRVTDTAGPINLEYSGSSVFNWVLNFNIGLMLIGIFLIVTAIASLLALARKCLGATFKVIYVLMAVIVFLALAFIMVVSIVILVNDDSEVVKDFLSQSWNRTVQKNSKEVCRLEEHFNCRGFLDNDCVGCELGTEASCSNPACAKCDRSANVTIGCYEEIVDSVHKFYLPTAIISGLLAFVVLVDIFVACAL